MLKMSVELQYELSGHSKVPRPPHPTPVHIVSYPAQRPAQQLVDRYGSLQWSRLQSFAKSNAVSGTSGRHSRLQVDFTYFPWTEMDLVVTISTVHPADRLLTAL